MSRTIQNLSVALMGAFAGGCHFVSTVLVPAWRKMDPEEVLQWFARNELRSGLTPSSLEAAGVLGATISFLRALREGSEGGLLRALSGLCMLATIAQLPLYFARTNRAMVIALTLLDFLQFAITWSSVRSSTVQRLVKGEPRLLFYEGRFLKDAMRSDRVTEEEIESAM